MRREGSSKNPPIVILRSSSWLEGTTDASTAAIDREQKTKAEMIVDNVNENIANSCARRFDVEPRYLLSLNLRDERRGVSVPPLFCKFVSQTFLSQKDRFRHA